MTVVAAGDVANLFSSSSHAVWLTIVNETAWPTGVLVLSWAPWVYGRQRNLSSAGRPRGFLVPGAAAFAALAIIMVAGFERVDRVAVGLAAATLVFAGLRSALSIRQLRSISQERHIQAITDELTGLNNRRYLGDLLEEYFSERQRDPKVVRDMAFLFVDLDRFKEINDSFGHPAGDELLRQLGDRLRASIRGDDVAVRLGGDEFGVVVYDVELSAASEIAERLSAKLQEPFHLRSLDAHIGASIGIAMARDAINAAELVWFADAAMYRAKQSSSTYALHGEGQVGAQAIHLVEDLRVAIERGQLVLHYQPLLDLHSSRIVGVEALVRWLHPDMGMVPPLEFIPLAEESGLIGPITTFVLQEALGQVSRWRQSGNHLSVSVNVSPVSLLQEGFVALVEELLGEAHLEPDALVIEITETVVIKDFERSRRVIERLMSMGVVVSIDDFGAGATSLTYLTNLGGVGEMKLDRSFIAGLADQTRELELVRATIDLGHAMGLRVVAEGIEDAGTLGLIAGLGCDLAQGYHISRPQPAAELAFRPLALSP
jgi:diguanylate cyclase